MANASLMLLCLTAMPANGGVIVGTPIPSVLERDNSLQVQYAEASVNKMVLKDAGGTTHEEYFDQTVDLLGGTSLDLPPGTWTEATLVLDGPIRIGGTGNGGTFDLEIEVSAIFLKMPSNVVTDDTVSPTTALHFGCPGWLTATALSLVPQSHVQVDATHPLHDALRSELRYESSWH